MSIYFSPDNLLYALFLSFTMGFAAYILLWFVYYALLQSPVPEDYKTYAKAIRPFINVCVVGLAVVATLGAFQAHGPRMSIKTTIKSDSRLPNEAVKDMSPDVLTDEERMRETRQLDKETKSRTQLRDGKP